VFARFGFGDTSGFSTSLVFWLSNQNLNTNGKPTTPKGQHIQNRNRIYYRAPLQEPYLLSFEKLLPLIIVSFNHWEHFRESFGQALRQNQPGWLRDGPGCHPLLLAGKSFSSCSFCSHKQKPTPLSGGALLSQDSTLQNRTDNALILFPVKHNCVPPRADPWSSWKSHKPRLCPPG
jgi:hypothetical protein